VFGVVQSLGRVPTADLEATLNMGVGMVAVVAPDDADLAVQRLAARGVPAWVIGGVGTGDRAGQARGDVTQGSKGVDGGAVRMVGSHPH
jgi:phosphoribosylformylglycinamidine cyclo-ligase